MATSTRFISFSSIRLALLCALAVVGTAFCDYTVASVRWVRRVAYEPVVHAVQKLFANEPLRASMQQEVSKRGAAALQNESMWRKVASRLSRDVHVPSAFVSLPMGASAA